MKGGKNHAGSRIAVSGEKQSGAEGTVDLVAVQRDTVPPEEEAPPVNALPERDAPPMPVPVQPTRHQQYDAIMQRMKVAQGRTGAFTSCGTSTQDSSGK